MTLGSPVGLIPQKIDQTGTRDSVLYVSENESNEVRLILRQPDRLAGGKTAIAGGKRGPLDFLEVIAWGSGLGPFCWEFWLFSSLSPSVAR